MYLDAYVNYQVFNDLVLLCLVKSVNYVAVFFNYSRESC